MKKTFLFLMLSLMSWPSLILAQDGALPDNFLFDDSDIIVTAPQEPSDTAPDLNTDENISQAVSSASVSDEKGKWDVCFVAPQIKYAVADVQAKLGIPTAAVDMRVYAMADGKAAYEAAKAMKG